jgi:DNA-binding transcriptional LysR family regulator
MVTMNFTNLKYFIDTATEGSIQKAAKINFVSQPAVSQGIKKLENELDLLRHQRNSINLTKNGQALLKISSPLFQSISKYELELGKLQNRETGKLTIGISNSLVSLILSSALRKFSKKYPKVDLKIKVGKTNDQVSMLEKGKIDLGITINNGTLDKYHSRVIHQGHFYLVGRANSQNRLIMTEDRPETIAIRDSILKNKNLGIENETRVESWSTILDLVKAGHGYGLLPDFIIKKEKLHNISKDLKLPRPPYKIVYFTKNEFLDDHFLGEFNKFLHEI